MERVALGGDLMDKGERKAKEAFGFDSIVCAFGLFEEICIREMTIVRWKIGKSFNHIEG